jgi:hypothetical protein
MGEMLKQLRVDQMSAPGEFGTEAFVRAGLDDAFSLYMGPEVSYISDTWVGLRLRQVMWLV